MNHKEAPRGQKRTATIVACCLIILVSGASPYVFSAMDFSVNPGVRAICLGALTSIIAGLGIWIDRRRGRKNSD